MAAGAYPFPPIKVQVAFASTPLNTSPTWTDISTWVQNIKIERGRSHILQRFEPGRLTLVCNGRDRALDPLNTSSQFYPNVDVNKQIQVLVQWSGSWVPLYTGFVDAWKPQWLDNLSTEIEVTATDGLRMLDTDTITSTYRATILADGATHLWALDDTVGAYTANDAVGTAIGVYTGPYQLGQQGPNYTDTASTVSLGAGGMVVMPSVGTLSAPCSLEVWFSTTTEPKGGQSAYLFGTGGPQQESGTLSFVQSAQTSGLVTAAGSHPQISVSINARAGDLVVLTVFSANGNTNAVNDTAGNSWSMLKRSTSSTTVVEIWACVLTYAITAISAVSSGSFPAISLSAMEFTGASTVVVDVSGGGSVTAGHATGWSYSSGGLGNANDVFIGIVGNNSPSMLGTGPFPISVSGPTGSTTLAQLDIVTSGTNYTAASSISTYEVLSSTSSVTYSGTATGGLGDAGSFAAAAYVTITPATVPAYHLLRMVPNSGIIEAASGSGLTPAAVRTRPVLSYADGIWHHAVLTVDGSDVLRLYVDGTLQGSAAGAAASVSGKPQISQAFNQFVGFAGYAATYPTALTAAQVLAHYQQGFTGFPVEDSGSRITRVLTAAGWPSAWQSIATGVSNTAQPTGDLTQTGAYSYMQDVEKAENGYLFVNAAGILTFLNRATPLHAPANVSNGVFGDGPGEIPFTRKPAVMWDNIDLFNASIVSRAATTVMVDGIVLGVAAGVPQRAVDATSIAKYGVTSTFSETGLLITTDAECLARAQWNVAHFKQIAARVDSIIVEPLADPTVRFPQVLFRDLTDRVTVNRRPWSVLGFGFPMFTQDINIEHISHEIDKKTTTWKTTYIGSAAETGIYWLLGDPLNGLLGSTTILSY